MLKQTQALKQKKRQSREENKNVGSRAEKQTKKVLSHEVKKNQTLESRIEKAWLRKVKNLGSRI